MGKMLIETYESIKKQTFPAHEIILVNDGSTDNTNEIISSLEGDFHYLRRDENFGVSKARNAGADHATGNWLLFLDGDDHLFPDALAHFAKNAALGGAGVIVGRVEQLDPETGKVRERTFRDIGGEAPHGAKMNFWRSLIASPGAVLVHAALHHAIGGFTKPWQPTEDRDFYIRCGVTSTFRFCDEFVLEKMFRENSMRIYSDIGVFWGAKVQMEFLGWCAERGISTEFLNTGPQEIILRNLKKTIKNHDVRVMKMLLRYAEEQEIALPGFWKFRSALEKFRGGMMAFAIEQNKGKS